MLADETMSDAVPDILCSFDRAGRPVAVVARQAEFADLAAVLARHPALLDRRQATVLAGLVNHFARGFSLDVITDSVAFEADCRLRVATEKPDAPFDRRRPRLRDFGLPDFAAIRPPVSTGGRLVFFARSRRLGVAYRVETAIDGASLGPARYLPVPTAALR